MEEKKALKDLNLINRFLFAEVMDDPEVNQDALSIILGQNIRLLSSPQTEKEHRVSPLAKSIRMDVFSVSEEGTVYDMEAQSTYQTDLQKRSRYYQSLMDSSLLEPGVDNYNQLNDSYIIVIADYDIFGLEKYCYTFKAMCEEHSSLSLGDGAVRIFLNTRGKNESEVSDELVEFLHYMENTTDKVASETGSERIQRIHERVNKAKRSEAVGMRFMREMEERNAARVEGRMEGRMEGRKEGRMEGRMEGRREDILKLLANLGDVPDNLTEQIQGQKDEDVLMNWLLLAAKAESIEDFASEIRK